MARGMKLAALGIWSAAACAQPAPSPGPTAAPLRQVAPGSDPAPSEPAPIEPTAVEPIGPVAAEPATTPASPEPAAPPAPAAPAPPKSRSLGYPNDGTLQDAAALPLSIPSLRFNPNRDPVARYSSTEVIAAIARAADAVRDTFGEGQLTVNDLSLQAGGPIPHHGSHRNGRDADILFYLVDGQGRPMDSVGAPLDPAGRGDDYKDLSVGEDDVPVFLDAPRTWRFVQALLEDPEARVQRIFVVEHIRSLLLAEAAKQKAPAAAVQLFSDVTCQPGMPHDDHLHVRWFCHPSDIDQGCEDMFPMYPWHTQWLKERGTQPVMYKRRRKPPPSKKVTHSEARKKAGKLHPEVKAFLKRRKAWLPAPHPNRKYCK